MEQVLKFREVMERKGLLDVRRREQAMHWVSRHLQRQLMDRANDDPDVQALAK